MTNKIIFVLANIGLLVSLYLLWTYVSGSPIVCSTEGCDLVRTSSYSHIFGIPQPVFGVIFYVLIIIFSFLAGIWQHFPENKIKKIILIVAVFGFVYSAYLTYLEAFVIHGFCDWCLASAIITTLILAVSVKENFYGKVFKFR